MTALVDTPAWNQITQPQRYDILSANGIRLLPTIAVGTTEEILDTLRQTKLSELKAISDAMPTRFNNAGASAAKVVGAKGPACSFAAGRHDKERRRSEVLARRGRGLHSREDERRPCDTLIRRKRISYERQASNRQVRTGSELTSR